MNIHVLDNSSLNLCGSYLGKPCIIPFSCTKPRQKTVYYTIQTFAHTISWHWKVLNKFVCKCRPGLRFTNLIILLFFSLTWTFVGAWWILSLLFVLKIRMVKKVFVSLLQLYFWGKKYQYLKKENQSTYLYGKLFELTFAHLPAFI